MLNTYVLRLKELNFTSLLKSLSIISTCFSPDKLLGHSSLKGACAQKLCIFVIGYFLCLLGKKINSGKLIVTPLQRNPVPLTKTCLLP